MRNKTSSDKILHFTFDYHCKVFESLDTAHKHKDSCNAVRILQMIDPTFDYCKF